MKIIIIIKMTIIIIHCLIITLRADTLVKEKVMDH